ncbi:MAG TPA: helix-turn-helix transcriptional regulator [Anaerolineales bacterium]|nr:helix-turn-helix transcriptional regulator [Anaerolineales bacterium]
MSNNFAKLLEEKEKQEGRFITLTEVANETKIMRRTLYKWANNDVKLYDPNVVDTLCKYFGVEMTDLIEHTPLK